MKVACKNVAFCVTGAERFQKNTGTLKQPLFRPIPAAWSVTCVTARPQLLSLQLRVFILQLSHNPTGVGDSSGFPGIRACPKRIHPAIRSRGTVVGEGGV